MKSPEYRLVDTAGQITAIITSNIPTESLAQAAIQIMRSNKRVEQVGLLRRDSFTMMGGELSVNALLAAAYLLNQSGTINNLSYTVVDSTVSLLLPCSLVLSQTKDTVVLRGISYRIVPGIPTTKRLTAKMKSELQQLVKNSPAGGLIYYRNNRIFPLVYVPSTNTYVWENACGSGSLAFSLITGVTDVVQPSGQNIRIKNNKSNILVTTSAKEV